MYFTLKTGSMDLSHIEYWVFDLDNTLYPAEARLFDQIEARMEQFIMRELGIGTDAARKLRADFWHNHGTTLAGLMEVYGIDPDPFLQEVHDIDLAHLAPAPDLAAALFALPGYRAIYTNGSRQHGENVSSARGIRDAFHAIFGIEDAAYHPKPAASAFDHIIARAGIDPARAIMFEDDPRNLIVPARLGMVTVLVGAALPGTGAADITDAHIHHHTADLAGFLQHAIICPACPPETCA